MAEPLLQVTNVSFRAGGRLLLDGLEFSLQTGERLSIIGPNGAGKTTLLKCLMGVHRGFTGSILLSGQSLPSIGQKQLAKISAWLPQMEGGVPPFTVEEFVRMGRYAHLKPFAGLGRVDREAVEAALILCGLADLRARTVATLSGGERQKVQIAAALAQDAPLLLLDEPTTFLDPRQAIEIEDLLFELHRHRARTLLVVTHDINRAILDGDRVLGLKAGRVAFDIEAVRLFDSECLDRLFGREKRPFVTAEHPDLGCRFIVPDQARRPSEG